MKIFVTTQFEALHRWKDAPEETAFLRQFHRHLFKVRLEVSVTHNDRDLEFLDVKSELDFNCAQIDKEDAGSCEMIAQELLRKMSKVYPNRKMTCEVSEDGENGAIVNLEEAV